MMTLLIASLSFSYKGAWLSDQFLIHEIAIYSSLMLLNTLILAWSVLKIRKTIQSIKNAFPNEKLIRIHVINCCLSQLTFFLLLLFFVWAEAGKNFMIYFFNVLVSIIAFAFQLYMDMFLLYVIQRFTRPEIRKSETDKVLGR